MNRPTICSLGLLVALGMGSRASAAILDVTYKGTVGAGTDSSGVFGVAGASLSGESFTASYRFDDSNGVRTTLPPYLDDVIGGPFNGNSDPSLGATLTINGKTVSFNGANFGLEENYPLGGSVSSYAANLVPVGQFDAGFIGNSLAAKGIPPSLDTAFSAQGTPGTNGFVNAFQVANGPGMYEADFASGTLDPASVAVTVAAGIANGNFSGSLTGWTVGGTVIWADGQIYNPCCGTPVATTPTFAAFGPGNVTSINTLSQTFTTNPGTTYTLSFDSGALGAGSEDFSYALTGGGSGSGTILEIANNSLVSTFSPTTLKFTATGASTTITFTDGSSVDNIDPVLTNVSLSVPEPSIWAMMLVGFGGLGAAMRLRRKLAAVTA